jgi:hypothetical protein
LHPGFHSGTLPKLYRSLRRAERSATMTGNWQAVRVCGQHLHEVERALQRLLDREVVTLVEQSPAWQGQRLKAGNVGLASNRFRMELLHPAYVDKPVQLEVEDRSGWLIGGIRHIGWLDHVPVPQRQAVQLALAGLYKLSGIDIVREQLEVDLPPEVSGYDLTSSDLVIRLRRRADTVVHYDLTGPETFLIARTPGGLPVPEWAPLDARRILFKRVPISWQKWVETWQQDQDGKPPGPLLNGR